MVVTSMWRWVVDAKVGFVEGADDSSARSCNRGKQDKLPKIRPLWFPQSSEINQSRIIFNRWFSRFNINDNLIVWRFHQSQ